MSNKLSVPVKDKFLQTLNEASEYFGIGVNRLRELTDKPEVMNCILYVGNRRMIKRKNMEDYLSRQFEI